MKAKNSLRAMLWPLISAIFKLKYRLFNSRKPQKTNRNPFNMDFQKVAADSKRIAEKMQQTQLLAEESKLQNKSPSCSAPGEQSNTDPENGRVLYGWREDEDDRFSTKDYSFTSHRQNPYCDQHPEKMKAIMKAFFLADHDAAQLEQYELENGSVQQLVVRRPAQTLKQALYRGLRAGLVLIFILGGQSVRVKAQTEIKALKIGDKVPDVTIQNIINYSSTTANISDFKGKLLILDFWATWCGTCLQSIPKTEALEEQFQGQVRFLPVTYQTEKEVDVFLDKLQKLKPGIKAKSHVQVVDDQVLHQLFPHTGLPHYVWIDRNGVIQAITEFKDVTADNISRMLQKGSINAAVKLDDPFIPYEKLKPLLMNLAEGSTPVFYHAALTGYAPGLKGGMDVLPAGGTQSRKIILRNVPLTWHYRTAFGEGKKWFGAASMALEVSDPLKLENDRSSDYNTWLGENGYCYELQLPLAHDGHIYKLMQQDLERLFPQYEAFTEIRKKTVLALIRTSDVDKLLSKGGKSEHQFSGLGASMTNTGLGMLTSQLSILFLQNLSMPIVNDTGYKGKTDLQLQADLSNVKAINRELEKYDLKLIEKVKDVEVLVIRDREK